ncbi:MAG: hydroxylamine reductase [Bacteroidota bacterium]
MSMFCYQCQETAKGSGCTIKGVCGKSDEVANMMDLMMFTLKGISIVANLARKQGIEDNEADRHVTDCLFMTITNANFDKSRFVEKVEKGIVLRDSLLKKLELKGVRPDVSTMHESVRWTGTPAEFEAKAATVGVLATENEDVRSLRELLIYGIKGVAAYAEHARNLGYEDSGIYEFMMRGMAATADDTLSADALVALVMECGKIGVDVMALLDKANTTTYGNPEITKVNIGVRKNPAILISGHDLRDMEDLLKQTDGTGVDVYTHSEMLPANYYPAFKKYTHFVGNYGNAWWKQKEEFESFNGPILFTSNCLVPPPVNATYKERVYTTGIVGFDNFKHVPDRTSGHAKDFSAIIEQAKTCAAPVEIETGEIIGGFAHAQVFALADKVVDAVKTGAIRKFIVMAGCDGRMKDRNYYTEFAEKLPKDTVILTAGCAKYRYNKLPLGDINGIPRVLDAGQCNDSYSLALIALKLKEVFQLNDINDLPIVYNVAWYEQKAVLVLLALLHLGVKNIHLGPTLPGFLSPNIAKVLIDTFGLGKISTADEDLVKFMN